MKVPAAFIFATLTLAPWAAAQPQVFSVNGEVYDGKGGPLNGPNAIYVIKSSPYSGAWVPAGKTLTIGKGAILKFDGNNLDASGTLIINGAQMTSYTDDSWGGDTNGDGPSVGSPGSWHGIRFLPGSEQSRIQNLHLRFAGKGSTAAPEPALHVRTNKALGGFTAVRIESCAGTGLSVNWTDTPVASCRVEKCLGYAFDRLELGYIDRFTNNSANGNRGGDYAAITQGTVWKRNITLQKQYSVNNTGTFVFRKDTTPGNNVVVAAGYSLTLPAGTICKFETGFRFHVIGTLLANGTNAAPVRLTSLATSPAPGDWDGVWLTDSAGASVLKHLVVRHGGQYQGTGIRISGCNATLSDCEVDAAKGDGMKIENGAGSPTVTGCNIINCTGRAIHGPRWDLLAKCLDNTASGNAGGDFQEVLGVQGVQQNTDLSPRNYPGDALVADSNVNVLNGVTLTLRCGVVVKFRGDAALTVWPGGGIRLLGDAASPVVLTTLTDDAYGGDTNKDGSQTTPTPGSWRGLAVNAITSRRAAGKVQGTIVRYAGRSSQPAVSCNNPLVSMDSVRVEHAAAVGFELLALGSDAMNLIAWKCGGTGIRLVGFARNVVHATVALNGGAGIEATTFGGTIANSIAWLNTGGNFKNVSASQVRNSNGGFASQNGNVSVDPRFVDSGKGDLGLRQDSPCLGAGSRAWGFGHATDAAGHSRWSGHGANGPDQPDMGAHEAQRFPIQVTGNFAMGHTVVFRVVAPGSATNRQVLAVGALDGTVYLPGAGYVVIGVNTLVILGFGRLGDQTTLPIPVVPAAKGLCIGVQGLVEHSTGKLDGGVTEVVRTRL